MKKIYFFLLLVVPFPSFLQDNNSIPAPLFIAKTIKGDTISLSGLKGKVVVLNFWATWCGPCIKEIPDLNKLVKKYDNNKVIFVAITDESSDAVKSFTYRRGIEFLYQQIADGENILNQYATIKSRGSKESAPKLKIIPINVVIDTKGNIIFYQKGGEEKEGEMEKFLSESIDKALSIIK